MWFRMPEMAEKSERIMGNRSFRWVHPRGCPGLEWIGPPTCGPARGSCHCAEGSGDDDGVDVGEHASVASFLVHGGDERAAAHVDHDRQVIEHDDRAARPLGG